MPEVVGDLAEFAFTDEVEIEEDEGEVAIAQEEIDALEGLLGFMAAEPEEETALFVAVGGGIEGIASIDEGDGEVAWFVEEFRDDERDPGGGFWGDDFAEVSCGEFQFLRFGNVLCRNRGAMGSRELLAKLAAEVGNLQDAQDVFIRTLKKT